MIDFKHGTFSNAGPAQDDAPSLEALGKLLAARDRRAAGVFTPAELAAQKVAELLLSGCEVRVDSMFPPGQVTAIDDTESLLGMRCAVPDLLRAVRPTRMVGFHSEAERDRFIDAFKRAYSMKPREGR